MNWQNLKKFIRFHIANSKFGVVLSNPKDISNPITKAVNDLSKTIQGKRNDIVNPESISDPIVEAQEATTEAIKGIKIPEPIPTDFTSLEAKLEALLEAFEKKEMVVNVGKTELDSKGIIKAIQKIKLEIPKMEKQEVIDYTMMFSEMMDIMEKPFDQSEIIRLQGMVSKLGTSLDLAVLAEWLKVIAEKPYPEFPELKFNKDGRLKVEVDRAGGGGGGGLTSIETNYLKEIAENTADIEINADTINLNTDEIENKLDKLVGFEIPAYDTQEIDESGAPAVTVITYKKGGVAVATKTITVSGTTTTISVT